VLNLASGLQGMLQLLLLLMMMMVVVVVVVVMVVPHREIQINNRITSRSV